MLPLKHEVVAQVLDTTGRRYKDVKSPSYERLRFLRNEKITTFLGARCLFQSSRGICHVIIVARFESLIT
jgi:hypothetical protein